MLRRALVSATFALLALLALLAGGAGEVAAASKATNEPRAVTVDDLKSLKWRSVGPANMGGRVGAIALAPGNSKTFYVGYGTGGVFKTDNFGTTFSPVLDKTGQHSIGAIAVADAPADWKGWDDEKETTDHEERG